MTMQARIERSWIEVIPDNDPDASYLEQTELGFEERLAAYRRGEFGFVGVRACAELRYVTAQGGWIVGPPVKSPGLWGIESDSGEDYLRSVGDEQRAELAEMVGALGLTLPPSDGQLLYV